MISVIIPTLNEAQTVACLLGDLKLCKAITQIIVVDGGSKDGTQEICEQLDIAFLVAKKGKSHQMNEGAAVADNDYLLFLHADSRITIQSLNALQEAIHQHPAGCFYLEFDKNKWLYKLYAYFSKFNTTLFTYGDQGLFVRKQLFDEIGGYASMPIMEDLDIIQRLKRKVKFVKLDAPIITSARRFEKVGIVKQQLINILLVVLYKCGVSPKVLKKYYPY